MTGKSPSDGPLKHLRGSDIRGIAQLATLATSSVTRIVEDVHRSVLDTVDFPGGTLPIPIRSITELVYKTVNGVRI